MMAVSGVAVAIVIVAMTGGFICMIVAGYHGISAAKHRKSGAPYRWIVELNRWQAGWFAEELDEIGLNHRRLAFKYQTGAAACLGLSAVIGVALLAH